jgi:hypothetical protein
MITKLIVSLMLLLSIGALESQADSAIIKCDSEKYDFGNIVESTEVSHDFYVQNVSAYPVKILDIGKSCGCISANIDIKNLDAGKKAKLSIDLKPNLTGKVYSLIKISWQVVGDKNQSGITSISLYANVLTVLDYDPHLYDFGTINADASPITTTLNLSKGNANIDWTQIQTTSRFLKLETVRKGVSNFSLIVTLDPSKLSCGSFHDEIDIKPLNNNAPLPYEYKIPFLATITSEVTITPSVLYLGLVSNSKPKSGQFQVSSKDNKPLEFISIRSSIPNFMTSKLIKNDGEALLFDYNIVPQSTTGEQYGTLTIKVKGLKERILSLPFLAYVKASG